MGITSYNNTASHKPSVLDAIILQGVETAPLLEMIPKSSLSSYKHSWISDRYRDAKDNANLEVSDVGTTPTPTKVKTENVCQIIKNEVQVSERQKHISQYGQDELSYQRAKVGKEHAKDIEYAILGLGNTTVYDSYVDMTATTEARMAGIPYFIPATNRFDFDDGTGNPSDFTYDHLIQMIEPVWNRGGLDNGNFKIFMGSVLKQKVNSWLDSKPYLRVDVKDGKYDPRVLKIATDYGDVDIVLHRLFGDAKLSDKVLLADITQIKAKELTSTKLMPVSTSKTEVVERYYADVTVEVTNGDYLSIGENLQ